MRLRTQTILTAGSKTTKHIGIFLLSMVLTRYLDKDTYGSYLQVHLISDTVIYLAILGIPQSIYYFLPTLEDKRKFIEKTAQIMLVIAVLSGVIIFFSTEKLSQVLNNPSIANFSLLIASFILFQIPIKIFQPIMISIDRVYTFVKVNLSFNVAFFFVIFVPLILHKPLAVILYSLLVFYIIQFLTISVVTIVGVNKLEPDNKKGIDYSFSKQMKYSLPIGFSGVIGELSRQLDKIIIGIYFLPGDYAVYARGAMEIPLINVISHSISNILMPRFVALYNEGDITGVLRLWHSSIKVMAFFIYPMFIYFMFTADLLIPVLFSDKYMDSTIIFRIYLIALISRITTYDVIVRAVGKTHHLLFITIFAVVFNSIASVILVQSLGRIGPAIATVLVVYLIRIYYVNIVSKLLHVSIVEVFPWKGLGQILLASSIAMVPSFFARYVYQERLLSLFLVAFIFAPIYLWVVKKLRALSTVETDAIRGLLPKKLQWVI